MWWKLLLSTWAPKVHRHHHKSLVCRPVTRHFNWIRTHKISLLNIDFNIIYLRTVLVFQWCLLLDSNFCWRVKALRIWSYSRFSRGLRSASVKKWTCQCLFNTLCNWFLSHIVSYFCVSVIILNDMSNDNRSFRNITLRLKFYASLE
jgi:hypothetical protein